MVKNQLASAGDTRDRGLIPESGRSPGRWDGNPPPVFMPGEPQREEPGRLQSMGSQRVRHDRATNTFTFTLSPLTHKCVKLN